LDDDGCRLIRWAPCLIVLVPLIQKNEWTIQTHDSSFFLSSSGFGQLVCQVQANGSETQMAGDDDAAATTRYSRNQAKHEGE
jgi:hypothetical protein